MPSHLTFLGCKLVSGFIFVCLSCCSYPGVMADFTLEVTTGSMSYAGTFDHLYVTLIGTKRSSEHTQLTSEVESEKMGTYSVTTLLSLGCLLLLKLEKDPFHESPEQSWYCSKIVVRTPEGDEILFPCHTWLTRGGVVFLRGGRATKVFEDGDPRLVNQRKKERVQQKLTFKWDEYEEGLAYVLYIKDPRSIPADIRYSYEKAFQVAYFKEAASAVVRKHGLNNSTDRWESFEAIKAVSWFKQSPIAEYVSEHWKDDDFFGYQLLNGVNPFVIQRCSKLPSNFPVTEDMMGSIFINDYKIMEGLPTRVIDGNPVAFPAPLCLLYLNPEKKLKPIAIQIFQQPSEENPIFLPSDSETDWLLAKIFVRNADAIHHQLISHIQNTHLLAEIFTIATLRNLPKVHPLHKLLIPHHRYTVSTNILARSQVYGKAGVVVNTSVGYDGGIELMRRGLSKLTYASLCVPEDIAARGLESIPNFYYRDDALRLWNIISSFVKTVVAYYYPSDSEVSADPELQEWANEIFYYGFLGNHNSGIPSNFQSVEEVIKFITMVIFTSSCQHAAVNLGQFDFQGWVPNAPFLLLQPPPKTKGQSNMETILETLPDKLFSGRLMAIVWQVSRKYDDFVPLGTYPDQHFDEPAVLQMIQDFQAQLSSLSVAITKRNSELELPYNYLNPTEIENSVTS
ncbi:hydroperoxide isomerase ALOXE3-like isoform X2 [Parambassis ranga]|uniref:Hydroperoxide isomerase ALOXE3-like isoform X2 n=1 Tax=Parambassis ranga TaxID=210632 RepID=A0A6P7HGW8_9TELE|nr:hydroperoxide isomerase ALOXE3-like isoform X2 [Parambassis ranga]